MSIYNGNKIKLSIFGQSHSKAIGMCLEGLTAGIKIDFDKLYDFLDKRRAKYHFDTQRHEDDYPEFISGLNGNYTCGTAITALIYNNDAKKSDYEKIKYIPRPSHCDYPAYVKYGKYHDFFGGGHFSGRLTAAICIAGGILIQILENMNINIAAHISNIGSIRDENFDNIDPKRQILSLKNLKNDEYAIINPKISNDIYEEISHYKKKGNSIGGSIECAILGLNAGIGYPMFDSLESQISRIAFAIPAVKSIEFGIGSICSKMSGSKYNDEYYIKNNKIFLKSNNAGGILGGLSTGMPIIFKVAIKPTPSISIAQKSVNLIKMQEVDLKIKGRHDACIVPRCVPAIEAVSAIAIYDSL